ncbi:hypothetical protein OAW22_08640 [Pseudomonadales bacterium]|nr:hypothetical protein [Pseudomonadales bacterium]
MDSIDKLKTRRVLAAILSQVSALMLGIGLFAYFGDGDVLHPLLTNMVVVWALILVGCFLSLLGGYFVFISSNGEAERKSKLVISLENGFAGLTLIIVLGAAALNYYMNTLQVDLFCDGLDQEYRIEFIPFTNLENGQIYEKKTDTEEGYAYLEDLDLTIFNAHRLSWEELFLVDNRGHLVTANLSRRTLKLTKRYYHSEDFLGSWQCELR